jgi:N-acetylglucosaminyldiphosphoundecaprenol N-acetyl-beta-D-mannosaminyltransferase
MSDRVSVGGADCDVITHAELIEHVVGAIRVGVGGTIVTPNVDICRQISKDPATRELVSGASLVVPDGMPLLWAARLAGRPLIERITGSDLIFSLSAAAGAGGLPVYLIGGMPGREGLAPVARLAADRLESRYPGLKVAGAYSPPARFDAAADDIEVLGKELAKAEPKIVFVGLGFPKQERLMARLEPLLPGTWFVGCGSAVPYAAGELRRAPAWMQAKGLEWLFRLITEPRRLAGRYLRDLPFAAVLLARSAWHGLARRGADDGQGRLSRFG